MAVWVQVPLAVLQKKIDSIQRDCLTNIGNLFVLVKTSLPLESKQQREPTLNAAIQQHLCSKIQALSILFLSKHIFFLQKVTFFLEKCTM